MAAVGVGGMCAMGSASLTNEVGRYHEYVDDDTPECKGLGLWPRYWLSECEQGEMSVELGGLAT